MRSFGARKTTGFTPLSADLIPIRKPDDPSGLNADHVERIRRVLTALQDARSPRNLDLPGWRLHQLKGDSRTMERPEPWFL